MTTGPYYRDDFGYLWRDQPAVPSAPSRTAVAGNWTIGTGPARQKAPEPMPTGWKCGDCGDVLAPWVHTHRCDAQSTGDETAVLLKDEGEA